MYEKYAISFYYVCSSAIHNRDTTIRHHFCYQATAATFQNSNNCYDRNVVLGKGTTTITSFERERVYPPIRYLPTISRPCTTSNDSQPENVNCYSGNSKARILAPMTT